MTEIKDCLPQDARRHFINLRNVRQEAVTEKYQAQLRELRGQMAARDLARSGMQETQEWKVKEEHLERFVATELMARVSGRNVAQPLRYYAIDLITQCLYTAIGGYITCAIAGPVHRAAMISLICLGLLVGSASLTAAWHMEPHWYGIALLAVYAPCVWIGCSLRLRTKRLSISQP